MFIVIACMGVLILPFVGVYTINLTDVQYVRPVLGILFTLIVFMQNVRIPGLTIICAAGHYKETRYQAILEAVINITVSLGLVWKFGMAGVLLGTVCSYGYRSFEIVFYTSRHLVKGCAKKSMFRILRKCIYSGNSLYGWNICYSAGNNIFYYMVSLCNRNGADKCFFGCGDKLCG